MLEIKNLHVAIDGNEILRGIDLAVQPGEVHAIMGPNGSGKSTLAQVLAGREEYEVTAGSVTFLGQDLLEMDPEDRAREGAFLAFQYPVEIPGVSNTYFLKAALNAVRKHRGQSEVDAVEFLALVKEKMKLVRMEESLLTRPVNEGFSGGEKKRNEIFHMAVLEPRLCILDETDSGLDIDALRIVADGVNALRGQDRGFLVITHYQRLLNYIVPDFVHVLLEGRIVRSGGKELALTLEQKGYGWLEAEVAEPVGARGAEMSATLLERETTPAVAGYLADYEALRREQPGEPAFLAALRRAAIDRFADLGFPTTDQEEWRFTNVGPLARGVFRRPPAGRAALTAERIAPHVFEVGSRLVFVDGRFAPELSSLAGLPPGVVVDSLAHVLASDPGRVEPHLARHARFDQHPFVALNTALFADGAFVELPRGAVIPEPLLILHLASGAAPAAFFPRNLILAGEHSQSIIVESFVGPEGGVYFNGAVSETVLAPGAVVDHSKLQEESTAAFHFATMQHHQDRASNLYSHSISTGGALVRNDVNAVLAGEGADCTLNGLYVLDGSQFLDNHMRVDHAAPHCNSYELFKGILDGKSRAVFNGRIFVAKGAQKTDAKQSSRNLLLSKEALVNANPQLEIFADDVKCTHGSTVGQLDDEAVFYLRSRGIGAAAARSILTYAFASDIVERIKVPSVRQELTEFLFHRLPAGEVVRQAV